MARILINRMFYNVELGGKGSRLVLLHGFMGSATDWREHITYFENDFRTVAIDLPGHGQTDSPGELIRYSMPFVLDDLNEMFDWLRLDQVHLLGYSMGARVALQYAARFPERVSSLILESGSPGLATKQEQDERIKNDEKLALRLETEGIEPFVEFWQAQTLFASQSRLPAHIRTTELAKKLGNNPQGLAYSLRGMGTGRQSSLWDQLKDIHVPTLLIAGELDQKFVDIARRMADDLPVAQLAIVPDSGHNVHLEQPTEFNKLVCKFLCTDRRIEQI